MKRTAYFTPLAAARLVLAAACILLAAACTTDDDPSRPDNDGPVPLTFTAVRPAPMTPANTRAVPGKDEWKGDGTEKIGVQLKDAVTDNTIATGIYTITDKDGTVAALPGDKPIFWPDKTASTTFLQAIRSRASTTSPTSPPPKNSRRPTSFRML